MKDVAEVLELAIRNEVQARAFYASAAELPGAGEAHMVFVELAGMEDGHARSLVQRFAAPLAAVGRDAAAALRRFEAEAAGGAGGEAGELISRGDLRAVLRHAIGLELAARDGYRALAARFDDPGDRALCEELATAEQDHHDQLSRALVSVDTPFEDRPAL